MSQQERSHNFSIRSPERHGRKRPASERKVLANRQNALKSTGPKTARGKSYSRRNSLKHEFFAKDLSTAFPFGIEDPREFEKLHGDLRNEWRPVGVCEESEVEQIAVGLWKRQRQWRFENAELRLGLVEVRTRSRRVTYDFKVSYLLACAKEQVKKSGEIPQELKEEILAACPLLRELWLEHEDESRLMKMRSLEKYSEQRNRAIALGTVDFAIASYERLVEISESFLNAECHQQSIPHDNALDRILRYSGMIDRDLNRAYDRLERLQRRRKGELVPPSLNLNVNV
jgi:hypothetical protein